MYQKPSPNQQICYVYDEPFAIAYKKDIPQNPIEAAIEVIDVVEYCDLFLSRLLPIFDWDALIKRLVKSIILKIIL